MSEVPLYRSVVFCARVCVPEQTGLISLQGCLAHKKMPTPLGPPRTLGIGYGRILGGMWFLVSEVPLYWTRLVQFALEGLSAPQGTPLRICWV